jgi:hypothetical protein
MGDKTGLFQGLQSASIFLGEKKIHINQLIRPTRSEKSAVVVAGRKGGTFRDNSY